MDMAGLKKSLCGLDIEGEKNSMVVFAKIMGAINNNVEDTPEDRTIDYATISLRQLAEHVVEFSKDGELEDNADNVRWNVLLEVLANIQQDSPDSAILHDIAARMTYSDDEAAWQNADDVFENLEPADDPAPEDKPGTVHVEAHERGGVQVKAYDRSPPKTGTGGDTMIAVVGAYKTKARMTSPLALFKNHVVSVGARSLPTVHTGGDSLILDNQPIAKEGVLPYPDGRKLKKWEDLAVNIGREVPIVDEHPPMDNGNRGLLTGKEKVWGKAIIQQCSGKKALCARVALDDGAPVKSGYSIGYEFLEEKEAGVFGSAAYDKVQRVKPIDHLALTDYPRDADAKVKVAADSDCPFDRCIPTSYNVALDSNVPLIHNTPIAHDLYRFSPSARYAMDPDLSARAEKLRRAHPDMDKFALLAAADSIADETAANRSSTKNGS